MGINYHYANLTKREWFAADTFGENSKRSGLGCGLSARAFNLLLLGDERASVANPVSFGRWAADSVTLVGDNDNDWERYATEFADIGADVIVMIYSYDGFESIAEVAEQRDCLFMELCHLVVTQQALSLDRHLKEHFGANYQQRYRELCKKRPFVPKNLAFRKSKQK